MGLLLRYLCSTGKSYPGCYFFPSLRVSSSNTNEGAGWSSNIAAPWANTTTSNATEDTVYFFLQGQYHTLTNESFVKALDLYPLADYGNSYDLQGQQMYGEMRYICTAVLINEAAEQFGFDAFQYRYDNPHLGSNHGADLAGLFPSSSSSANAGDLALFEAMREYWTSFATGDMPIAQKVPGWSVCPLVCIPLLNF